jgi:hypothetical protein
MSSIQPRKQLDKTNPNHPLSNEEVSHSWVDNALDTDPAPVKITPKEQFKYGDVKSPLLVLAAFLLPFTKPNV